MQRTADAVLVGAGVMGASVAFHLARRGVRLEVGAEVLALRVLAGRIAGVETTRGAVPPRPSSS